MQVTVIHPQLSVDKAALADAAHHLPTNPEDPEPASDHPTHRAPSAAGPLTHHNPPPAPAHAKISAQHVDVRPAHTVSDVYFTSNVMEGAAVNSAGMYRVSSIHVA